MASFFRIRNALAHSHYPAGCDLGATWSRLVGLGFETTRGGLPRTTAASRRLGSARSQGARLRHFSSLEGQRLTIYTSVSERYHHPTSFGPSALRLSLRAALAPGSDWNSISPPCRFATTQLVAGGQLLLDAVLKGGIGEAAPNLIHFSQALFTLLCEMVGEGAWGQRTFPRQVLHSHIHIMNAAEHALDLMESLGKCGGVGSNHGRKEFCKVTGLAQRDAQFVQFFRRGRTTKPFVLPSAAQHLVQLPRHEFRQRTGRFGFGQPRQVHAQQAVDLEALAGEMPTAQTTTHGRISELAALLMVPHVSGKQPVPRHDRAALRGLQQVHPLIEIADGTEFFAEDRKSTRLN